MTTALFERDMPTPVPGSRHIAAVNLLARLHRQGVKLWVDDGRLRYRANKGALTRDDLETLTQHKKEILALLEAMRPHSLAINPREQSGLVPFTYSQLSHWHRYRLSEKAHLRQLARATRLSGPLSVSALRAALAAMFHRHEALRIRVVVVDGAPMQRIDESVDHGLEVEDLSGLPDELREQQMQRRLTEYVCDAVDVASGPLFTARLLRLGEAEHVLIVTMEHMISDGVSMNIFMRDLFVTYERVAHGDAAELPTIPVQFLDYAVWQRDAGRSWIQNHAEDLQRRLAACRRVRFPQETGLTGTGSGWAIVPIEIGKGTEEKLRECCRSTGVTLPMTVFAAYVALMLRWCHASEIVVRYVTDGRITPSLEDTIGYFAYLFFLKVDIRDDDRPLDLIKRVTEEYCCAQERPHLGYIEAQSSLPEFARGCGFNWVPRGDEDTHADGVASTRSLVRTPVQFEHPMLRTYEQDLEPFALFYDTADGILGGVHYPVARASARTMDEFARAFLRFIDAFVGQPEAHVINISDGVGSQ